MKSITYCSFFGRHRTTVDVVLSGSRTMRHAILRAAHGIEFGMLIFTPCVRPECVCCRELFVLTTRLATNPDVRAWFQADTDIMEKNCAS